jgi:hypothetical protein
MKAASFAEFWPYYLRAHADRRTRGFHYVGTVSGVLLLLAAVVLGDWRFLVAAPLAGYALAMLAHPLFERNAPATFTHPLWSFIADFYMLYLAATGRLAREIERASRRD